MHVMDIRATVPRIKSVAVGFGGFVRRHKRASIAAAVAALLAGPLATGDGEVVFVNAVGLGFGALLLKRLAGPNGRQRTGRAQQEQRQQAARAQQARQTARATTQSEGGHDDDASNDDWWDWDKAMGQPGRAGRPADGGAVQG